jgi:hypothetical protein
MSSVAATPAAWGPPVISVQRSSTDGAVLNASSSSNTSPTTSKHQQSKPGTPPPDTTWGSNFWVTLTDPQVSVHETISIVQPSRVRLFTARRVHRSQIANNFII